MNTFKKLYRDFFGLTESKMDAVGKEDSDINNDGKTNKTDSYLKKRRNAISNAIDEEIVDEAKLVNGIDEYQGGVMYAIKDPSQAQEVSDDIKQWAEKKGFTIIKRTLSKTGTNGYFYFRLGEDPEKDAQRIQGYFAQRLELTAFKFKVRGEAKPARELPPAAPKRSMRKI
jgi:hypothetical protein